jgi:hypothetical protein
VKASTRGAAPVYLAGGVAAALLLGLTLPTVRPQPLHIDETYILEFAPHRLPALIHDIFIQRGGAPLQFIVAHFTLQWPGGIEGLRLPSVAFTAAAIVLAGLWAERLAGRFEGISVPILLATSPLVVDLATFGRMYGMFLLSVLGASLLSLRAARRGRRFDWAVAGAAAGALVYVHPIAPLYAPFALGTGICWSTAPLRSFAGAVRTALIAGAVTIAPYVWALAVLTRRYDVGGGGTLGATGSRPVVEEVFLGMSPAPGSRVTAALVLAVGALGVATVARRSSRLALLLGLWVAVPVLFFSVIPAHTRFFVRYVVTALPPYLLLVAIGAHALSMRLRRAPTAFATAAVLVLVLLGVGHDVRRIHRTERIGAPRLLRAVSAPNALLLSSTGTPIADRPSEDLDSYVSLRMPRIGRLEELPALNPRFDAHVVPKGRAAVIAYLRGAPHPARGVWIFRGPARRIVRAVRQLAGIPGVEHRRVADTLLVVRSSAALPPLELIEQSLAVRTAWSIHSPSDHWDEVLMGIERAALASIRHPSSNP